MYSPTFCDCVCNAVLTMFGIYQNGIVPGAHNAWTAWADKVLEKKASLGFSKVALVSAAREHVLWYTGNFLPSLQEIKVRTSSVNETYDFFTCRLKGIYSHSHYETTFRLLQQIVSEKLSSIFVHISI